MTIGEAGIIDIVIYPGARFTQRLEWFDEVTGEPYVLTGMGPWLAEVTDTARGTLIVAIDVDDAEAAEGVLNISIEAEDTAPLAVPAVRRWGLMNASGEYVLDGKATIRKKAPR